MFISRVYMYMYGSEGILSNREEISNVSNEIVEIYSSILERIQKNSF